MAPRPLLSGGWGEGVASEEAGISCVWSPPGCWGDTAASLTLSLQRPFSPVLMEEETGLDVGAALDLALGLMIKSVLTVHCPHTGQRPGRGKGGLPLVPDLRE